MKNLFQNSIFLPLLKVHPEYFLTLHGDKKKPLHGHWRKADGLWPPDLHWWSFYLLYRSQTMIVKNIIVKYFHFLFTNLFKDKMTISSISYAWHHMSRLTVLAIGQCTVWAQFVHLICQIFRNSFSSGNWFEWHANTCCVFFILKFLILINCSTSWGWRGPHSGLPEFYFNFEIVKVIFNL